MTASKILGTWFAIIAGVAGLAIACTYAMLKPSPASASKRIEPAPQTPAPVTPSPAIDPDYDRAVAKAIADATAIEDAKAWHKDNDRHALRELVGRKRSLLLRTALIPDHGTRGAGHAFLKAIDYETDIDGEVIYSVDTAAVAAIDPEKLRRWATIALTVLEFAEPFVPPPYNLGVHAAVMLLKLYLSRDEPVPKVFGDGFRTAS